MRLHEKCLCTHEKGWHWHRKLPGQMAVHIDDCGFEGCACSKFEPAEPSPEVAPTRQIACDHCEKRVYVRDGIWQHDDGLSCHLRATPRPAVAPRETQPQPEGLINVFEVYSRRADSQGWDFIVYKSQQSALDAIDFDLDDLQDGEEVRIVFKRYTQEQMDGVIYE